MFGNFQTDYPNLILHRTGLAEKTIFKEDAHTRRRRKIFVKRVSEDLQQKAVTLY